MADIINLRSKRKEKTRDEKEKASTEKRVLFGQTKAAKQKSTAEKDKAKKLLDGIKRDKE